MFNFVTELLTQPVPLRDVSVQNCSQSFYEVHKDDVSIVSLSVLCLPTTFNSVKYLKYSDVLETAVGKT